MLLFDTHCHITDMFDSLPESFPADYSCIGDILSVTYRYSDWDKNILFAKKFNNIIPALGIHPLFIPNGIQNHLKLYESYFDTFPKLIVGEIGLDFYNNLAQSEKQKQYDLLSQQIDIAKRFQRPIVIHQRKAQQQCISLLKSIGFNNGGFAHGFSGSLEQAYQWIDYGFVLGIGCVLLNNNSRLRNILPRLPSSSWVLESDAPFMQKNNSPIIIQKIAKIAAQLCNKNIDDIIYNTTNNAYRILNLSY